MSFYLTDALIHEIKSKLPHNYELPHERIPGDGIAKFLLYKGSKRRYPMEGDCMLLAACTTDEMERYEDEDYAKVLADLKKELEILFGYEAEVKFEFRYEWEEIPSSPHRFGDLNRLRCTLTGSKQKSIWPSRLSEERNDK